MKPAPRKHPYIPCKYEIFDNFNFDLDLDFYDYLILTSYFVVVYPLALIGRLLYLPFGLVISKIKHEHTKSTSELAAQKKTGLYV